MKKVYMLMMAVLVAFMANAQVAMPSFGSANQQRLLPNPAKQIKNAPGEMLIDYASLDALYNGDGEMTAGYYWFIQTDTLGIATLVNANGANYTRPWVYSMSQTYDFNAYIYDDVAGEGQVSLTQSTSLNLDSIYLICDYNRWNLPASTKDTLIVGIITDDPSSYYFFGTGNPNNTCFYNFNFDMNTSVQAGAHIYKFPLGEEDAATEESYSELLLPIGLNNIGNKVWHVAFSFKRGYEIGVNDTLPSNFGLLSVKSQDPYYYIGDDDNNPINDPNRCENMSHGGFVWKGIVNSLGNDSYYYPSFMFDDISHFIRGLYLKTSCNDCAIVSVPEMEKNNMTVYPNPATNKFTVDLGNDEKANIQLFNLVGQMVYSETITGRADVNVANLHSGVYMLKVNQNGKVSTTKVVVK